MSSAYRHIHHTNLVPITAFWLKDSAGNIVDWHVRALRAKLEDDRRTPRYIETVSRIGYRFVSEPRGEANRPV